MKRLRLAAALLLGCALWFGSACGIMKGGMEGGAASQTCSSCNGTGESAQADPSTGAKGKCSACGGSGRVSGGGR